MILLCKIHGIVDCNIELEIEIKTANATQINVIDQIEKEPQKECKDYSMVIYFVKKEDSLWDIAKKFKSKTLDILKVNEIENEKQLHSGMQLFIPKYTFKNLA